MHQRRVFYYATDDYGYAHAHSAAAVAANYSRGYHTHDNGTDASGWKAWSELGGMVLLVLKCRPPPSDWLIGVGAALLNYLPTWLMCHIK